jgi:hypothetical protein
VFNHLRTQPNRLNVGYLFYYSYDSAGKSDMCDSIAGDLLPEVVAALMNHGKEAGAARRVLEFGAFKVKRDSAWKAQQVRPVHAACVSGPSCRESRTGRKLSQLPEPGAGV